MPRYGLAIDLERCIGCQTCTVACKMENSIERDSWIKVGMRDGQAIDTAAGKFPEVVMHYLPVPCMHCRKPPCRDACPIQAIYKREDGVVILDTSKCDGCRACITACPYNVILWTEKANVATKCHLCAHRIEKGLQPFCAICCETGAIHFGDLSDRDSEIYRLIARRSGYTLKPEEKTAPQVYYLPPLPKRPV